MLRFNIFWSSGDVPIRNKVASALTVALAVGLLIPVLPIPISAATTAQVWAKV